MRDTVWENPAPCFIDKIINMTSKDEELIKRAKALHFTDWYKAHDMAKEADTTEAKDELEFIARYLYHVEELSSGIL